MAAKKKKISEPKKNPKKLFFKFSIRQIRSGEISYTFYS